MAQVIIFRFEESMKFISFNHKTTLGNYLVYISILHTQSLLNCLGEDNCLYLP